MTSAAPRATARRSAPRASTRYLLTCAVLGVAAGLVTVGMNWASIGFAATAPIFISVTIAAWVLPSIVGLALLQKPGVGILIAVIGGLVNIPFTPFGVAQLPTAIVGGLLVELPFAIALYRVWKPWLFYTALPVLITIASTAWLYVVDSVMGNPPLLAAVYLLTLVVSAGFVWLALFVARSLRRAGVGRSIGRLTVTAQATAGDGPGTVGRTADV